MVLCLGSFLTLLVICLDIMASNFVLLMGFVCVSVCMPVFLLFWVLFCLIIGFFVFLICLFAFYGEKESRNSSVGGGGREPGKIRGENSQNIYRNFSN